MPFFSVRRFWVLSAVVLLLLPPVGFSNVLAEDRGRTITPRTTSPGNLEDFLLQAEHHTWSPLDQKLPLKRKGMKIAAVHVPCRHQARAIDSRVIEASVARRIKFYEQHGMKSEAAELLINYRHQLLNLPLSVDEFTVRHNWLVTRLLELDASAEALVVCQELISSGILTYVTGGSSGRGRTELRSLMQEASDSLTPASAATVIQRLEQQFSQKHLPSSLLTPGALTDISSHCFLRSQPLMMRLSKAAFRDESGRQSLKSLAKKLAEAERKFLINTDRDHNTRLKVAVMRLMLAVRLSEGDLQVLSQDFLHILKQGGFRRGYSPMDSDRGFAPGKEAIAVLLAIENSKQRISQATYRDLVETTCDLFHTDTSRILPCIIAGCFLPDSDLFNSYRDLLRNDALRNVDLCSSILSAAGTMARDDLPVQAIQLTETALSGDHRDNLFSALMLQPILLKLENSLGAVSAEARADAASPLHSDAPSSALLKQKDRLAAFESLLKIVCANHDTEGFGLYCQEVIPERHLDEFSGSFTVVGLRKEMSGQQLRVLSASRVLIRLADELNRFDEIEELAVGDSQDSLIVRCQLAVRKKDNDGLLNSLTLLQKHLGSSLPELEAKNFEANTIGGVAASDRQRDKSARKARTANVVFHAALPAMTTHGFRGTEAGRMARQLVRRALLLLRSDPFTATRSKEITAELERRVKVADSL